MRHRHGVDPATPFSQMERVPAIALWPRVVPNVRRAQAHGCCSESRERLRPNLRVALTMRESADNSIRAAQVRGARHEID